MFGKPGSILICVSDLPARVSRKDLKVFVEHAVKNVRSRGLRAKSTIANHTILRLTNLDTGTSSHQGLIAIQPARLALAVIDELCRIPLRGQLLKVYRYRHASFEANCVTRTKSMSELLGVATAPPLADKPRFTLDLVTTTGSSPVTAHRVRKSH